MLSVQVGISNAIKYFLNKIEQKKINEFMSRIFIQNELFISVGILFHFVDDSDLG